MKMRFWAAGRNHFLVEGSWLAAIANFKSIERIGDRSWDFGHSFGC